MRSFPKANVTKSEQCSQIILWYASYQARKKQKFTQMKWLTYLLIADPLQQVVKLKISSQKGTKQ